MEVGQILEEKQRRAQVMQKITSEILQGNGVRTLVEVSLREVDTNHLVTITIQDTWRPLE